MSASFIAALVLVVFFPFIFAIGIFKKYSFQEFKAMNQTNQLRGEHHITNFNLKQKSVWKWENKTLYLTVLNK